MRPNPNITPNSVLRKKNKTVDKEIKDESKTAENKKTKRVK
jgi:hypothetical protein